MIALPHDIEEAVALLASGADGAIPAVRAGGTDLQERRRHTAEPGPVVDLRDVADLDGIEAVMDGLAVGARVTIADLAADPRVVAGYPGLAAAAGGLATPQIRAVGTVGGNLLQRNRCWYFRHPDFTCLKKGGSTCYAREGDHLYHSCFDLGPCLAPHPSTLGMALLAYDAMVDTQPGGRMSVAALYGDGSNARNDHNLPEGSLLTGVVLPPPVAGERAAYVRAIGRARAEWPLVEVVVRLLIEGDLIALARVTLGGVAPVPVRLSLVEDALIGAAPNDELFGVAAARAVEGRRAPDQTAYKLAIIPGAIRAALGRAAETPTDGG